jgi:hypothetical protein
MDIKSEIKSVVTEAGLKRTAYLLDVSYQAVQKNVATGKIPESKVLLFSQIASFKLTPHQLRPDLYPYPDDGLPPELRCQCKDY